MLLVPLVAAAAAMSLLPTFLLSRAQSRADSCLRSILESGTGDPGACAPRSYETRLAHELPWLEREASQLEEDTRYRAALLAYGQATAIAPDEAARRSAAERFLDTERARAAPAAALASLEGAFDLVAERGRASDEPEVRAFAFKSARAIADLEALRDLSRSGDGETAPSLELWRGAMLCLLEEPEAGQQALLRADRLYRERASAHGPDDAELKDLQAGYGPALLALVACGYRGDAVKGRFATPYLPARMLITADNLLARMEGARLLLESPSWALPGPTRLRIAALALGPDPEGKQPEAVESLAFLAPRHALAVGLDVDAMRTPWLLVGASESEGLVLGRSEPAETAALHLAALADEVKDDELRCAGQECPVDVALTMPGRLLREGARMLWLEAAAEHARRGAREQALADLAQAAPLTPSRRLHESAPLHLAVGDAEGALAAADASVAENLSHRIRSRALVSRALALAHLGKLDAAHQAAHQAFAASLERPSPGQDDETGAALLAEQDRIAAAWLWAALALAADEDEEVIALLKDAGSERLVALAGWLEIATLPEQERRARRWNLAMREPVDAVLPAAMYLAGRALPPEADVEVWLDRVFHEQHRHQPLRSMLARAEAARWRGDHAAEKRWLTRAATLRGLVRDDRTALLAQLVELR